jgi:hypothetical protein
VSFICSAADFRKVLTQISHRLTTFKTAGSGRDVHVRQSSLMRARILLESVGAHSCEFADLPTGSAWPLMELVMALPDKCVIYYKSGFACIAPIFQKQAGLGKLANMYTMVELETMPFCYRSMQRMALCCMLCILLASCMLSQEVCVS